MQKELLYFKVIVVGIQGVGKTSILSRYCLNKYESKRIPTIGCDFLVKLFEYKGRIIRVQMWDIAGQEKYNSISKLFVRNAVGCIIVCDVTNKQSMESAKKWKQKIIEYLNDEKIENNDEKTIPIMLLQNKFDLVDPQQILPEINNKNSGYDFGELSEFDLNFQVSAKTGLGINEAMKQFIDLVAQEIYNNSIKKQFRQISQSSKINYSILSKRHSILPKSDKNYNKCCQ